MKFRKFKPMISALRYIFTDGMGYNAPISVRGAHNRAKVHLATIIDEPKAKWYVYDHNPKYCTQRLFVYMCRKA